MFTSAEEIIRRLGRDRVVDYTDDDRDGEPDDAVISELVADVNREVASLLRGKGFGDDAIAKLARDETLRRAAASIAGEYMGLRRPELIKSDGTTLFSPAAEAARKILNTVTTGERRLAGEKAAGTPSTLQGQAMIQDPVFYTAPSACKPRGPGSF